MDLRSERHRTDVEAPIPGYFARGGSSDRGGGAGSMGGCVVSSQRPDRRGRRQGECSGVVLQGGDDVGIPSRPKTFVRGVAGQRRGSDIRCARACTLVHERVDRRERWSSQGGARSQSAGECALRFQRRRRGGGGQDPRGSGDSSDGRTQGDLAHDRGTPPHAMARRHTRGRCQTPSRGSGRQARRASLQHEPFVSVAAVGCAVR
mmetsp:Transcript_4835/g.21863  ORF Transcript_4835/g.21863 Transcript_4835/m.21863 type:complete len:205 (-) Transcript_4835:3118-3732(-)